jgi:alginate O-acetyltransferase complex protein AlgI
MGGNRVTKIHWIFNMLTVWFLTGLWHGASLNFIIWGIYYGIILIFEKFILRNFFEKIPIIGHVYAIAVVIMGWVVFRADNLSQAFEIIGAMFGAYSHSTGSINTATLLQRCGFNTIFILSFSAGIIFSIPTAIWIKQKVSFITENALKCVSVIHDIGLIAVFIICLVNLATSSYNPFIYFRF